MTISQQLKEAITADNLTLYGASQIIGAETDEELKTIHRRLSRYISDNPPETLRQFEETVTALGYRIRIER